MKVFACRNQESNGGGLILVAATTREEAYLTAAMKYKCMFHWADDNGILYVPDGNYVIEHCKSYTYPLESWFEVEHLSTDLTEAKVIIEDSYSE